MDDANELARLRERVAELEQQLAASPRAARESTHRPAWWAVLSAVCLILGCALAPVSVASVWVRSNLADTDNYVDTVAPIARDPAVQAALADTVTTAVLESLDLRQLTSETLTTLADLDNMPPRVAAALPALTVPIASGIESFTRDQVEKALASPQFATVWAEVNRVAHAQVLRLLEGDQSGAVTAQDDTITLNLAPVIDQVRERMVAAGFGLAERIPTVDRSFTLVQSDAVTKAQSTYRLLDALGTWLPFVSLGLVAAGVVLARDRSRALVRGALGITAGMVLLAAGLAIVRTIYVDTTPGDVLTPDAAAQVFDTLVRYLRTSLRAVALLGLVVACAAFFSGRSPAATRARAGVERGVDQLRNRGRSATGWDTGGFGIWLGAHRRALRVTVIGLAGLVLLLSSRLTAWSVVWTALVTTLILVVLELLSAPRTAPAVSATPPPSVP